MNVQSELDFFILSHVFYIVAQIVLKSDRVMLLQTPDFDPCPSACEMF